MDFKIILVLSKDLSEYDSSFFEVNCIHISSLSSKKQDHNPFLEQASISLLTYF